MSQSAANPTAMQQSSGKITQTQTRPLAFHFPIEARLTYSQLLAEDRPLSQRRAVPAAVPELVLTLIDAHLSAFAHNNDGVRATLTDSPLARRQPGNLVADDVGAQSHHRGQGPAENRRNTCAQISTNTHTHTSGCRHKLSRLDLPEDSQMDSFA